VVSENIGIDIQSSDLHPFNSQKVLAHGYRMEAIVNEQYLPPVVLNLDVSGKCQYHCDHCHHRRKQTHDKQLPDLPEHLAKTLPYFLRNWNVNGHRVLGCCIVGSQGDALLYKGLPDLLRELHFSGTEIGLVTNGYGLDGELMLYAASYCKFIGFSMDAGTGVGYIDVKGTTDVKAWDRVTDFISILCRILDVVGLRNDVCWKMLILPKTYKEIYQGCQMAKEVGCRYVQIRPADLTKEEQEKIDIECVEKQIENAIRDLEEPGKFQIVGVRHKFDKAYKKVLPKYCYLTPLTVTVTSDGKAYACVDRRCDETTLLADCADGGWAALRDVWGSPTHVGIVREIINRGGCGPDCDIRCSNYGYDKYFRNYFVNDNVDRNMI
jgi:wyosine [tRNA(Phe)-imidazoG37] synthetase (radical SAM superfamily)